MPENLSDKIMNEITEQRVCPRPCWFYRLKKLFIWFSLIILVLIIGWSVAIDWYLLTSYDWEMARQTNIPLWRHAVMALPYLWLIVAGIGLWLVITLARKTDSGYRWPVVKSLAVIFVISGAIGFVGHLLKGDKLAHDQMMRSKFYRASVFTNDDLWAKPEWGVLSGTVVGREPEGNLIIRDPRNRIWHVDHHQRNIFGSSTMELKEGDKIKIKGYKEEACTMSAPIFRAHWGGFNQ